MELVPETVLVYNWYDIQEKICDIIGIDFDKFRNYHEIVGGSYKDLWHVCLEHIVPGHMENGTIVKLYFCNEEWLDLEEDDQWKLTLVRTWNQLYGSIVEEDTDPGIHVSFNW